MPEKRKIDEKSGENKPSDSRDSKTLFEFAKFTGTYLQDQIRLADTKAAWVFSVLGLLTAVLTNLISKFSWTELGQPRVFIFGIVAIFSLILAFKNAALVIYPRVSNGEKGGLIYFKDIAAASRDEYLESAMTVNEEGIVRAMHNQSYDLAKIAEKKFSSLRFAIGSAMFALGWIVVTAIMLAKS